MINDSGGDSRRGPKDSLAQESKYGAYAARKVVNWSRIGLNYSKLDRWALSTYNGKRQHKHIYPTFPRHPVCILWTFIRFCNFTESQDASDGDAIHPNTLVPNPLVVCLSLVHVLSNKVIALYLAHPTTKINEVAIGTASATTPAHVLVIPVAAVLGG